MTYLKFLLIFSSILLSSSCARYGLEVTKIQLDRNSLASTFAKTPDPRQIKPLKGQQLYIEWNMEDPTLLYGGGELLLKIIYKDFHEEEFVYPIKHSKGSLSHFHMRLHDETFFPIMTYKVILKDLKGQDVDEISHRMWFNLIPIEEES